MDGGASVRASSALDDLMKEAKEQGVWYDRCATLLEIGERSLLRDFLVNSLDQQEVINKKQEVINKKQEVIADQQEVIGKRSLQALKECNRPLSNRTASKPHVEKLKHSPAIINRVDYNFDDDIKVPYDAPYVPHDSSVDSETDVQMFILRILESISRSISSKEIHFAQNRRVVGVECDILLLYGKNRIPFSAVEIKKNGGDCFVHAIFSDDSSVEKKLKGKVQGEHLTQLEQIQFFGFEKVFGVISDGNHSMITCTGSFSKATDLPGVGETPNKKRSANTMKEESSQVSPDNAVRFVTKTSRLTTFAKGAVGILSKNTRSLYCSNYSDVFNDSPSANVNWEPSLKLLTHFVKLAINSVDPRQFCREILINRNLPARIIELSNESTMFAHSTIRFDSSPDLERCLLYKSTLNEILLFKHLGMGTNGDCCLATTKEKKKSFCAVKFFADRKSALDLAKAECSLWKSIYRKLPEARVVQLPPTDDYDNTGQQDACLCMPYLIPIDASERQEALKNGSICECLEGFATKNYHHNEVLWRHLGFFCTRHKKKVRSKKVYLCDLGNLTKRDGESDDKWKDETKTWITKCLESLSKTANEET